MLARTKQNSLTDRSGSVRHGLKQAVLTPLETLGQSIAGIAPSATPGMLIRAIMQSVIFSGLFFVLVSYAMVLSFRGAAVGLDKCSTPLLTMAGLVGIPALGHFIACEETPSLRTGV